MGILTLPNMFCAMCGLPAQEVQIVGNTIRHPTAEACRDALLAQREAILKAWEAVKPHVGFVGWAAGKQMSDALYPHEP